MDTTLEKIPSIVNDGKAKSYWGHHHISLQGDTAWMLSEQQSALNFRLRSSAAGYQSDWHVAGDPTLLLIQAGTIEIELRDGSLKWFSAGEMFVAQDYLDEGIEFTDLLGHRARVVGQETLNALHLKLSKR